MRPKLNDLLRVKLHAHHAWATPGSIVQVTCVRSRHMVEAAVVLGAATRTVDYGGLLFYMNELEPLNPQED